MSLPSVTFDCGVKAKSLQPGALHLRTKRVLYLRQSRQRLTPFSHGKVLMHPSVTHLSWSSGISSSTSTSTALWCEMQEASSATAAAPPPPTSLNASVRSKWSLLVTAAAKSSLVAGAQPPPAATLTLVSSSMVAKGLRHTFFLGAAGATVAGARSGVAGTRLATDAGTSAVTDTGTGAGTGTGTATLEKVLA